MYFNDGKFIKIYADLLSGTIPTTIGHCSEQCKFLNDFGKNYSDANTTKEIKHKSYIKSTQKMW